MTTKPKSTEAVKKGLPADLLAEAIRRAEGKGPLHVLIALVLLLDERDRELGRQA